MKQKYIDKFETKIKLNQALNNGYISKNNLEFILKHILKSNHYLIKHWNIIKHNVLDDMYVELNECLSYNDFFCNDKTLILWIARKFNSILKSLEYENMFNEYLKEKSERLNDRHNKYSIQLEYRTIIQCNDDCFNEYLPVKKSEYYYEYGEEKDKLYPQFDNEFSKFDRYGSIKELTENEIECIKNFQFNNIKESEVLKMIKEEVIKFKKTKEERIHWKFEAEVLRYIIKFEGIMIYPNDESSFNNILDRSHNFFGLLKENKIEYNVNDNYFIIEKDKFGYITSVKSFNELKPLIDLPEWVKYMRCHDIKNLDEMYDDCW